ncbi:ergothioneine biosynthesis protein EgtB [Frigoriflavimonas asaccharolytica]|uniref:Ergothioneine biosynthesis protein EgtB n=1 Tax=Frigoriflavimonas asaccharolytica TaxID=2735899 RepID=A0A8J8K8Z5_9FLAO|nr:ergothioneine biosynthesis protein EgtB [Frigoriflavimonas asaccharolytica]NRS93076.1 ergothioneine biosynthesis protein EgtB [Frigoriflavimonas asaccharolytica]
MRDLLPYYLQTRLFTINLCAPLQLEDYIPQPVDFASPPKWHLAHSTWFFEEMILKKFYPEYQIFHPDFSFLFNSYYQTIGKRAVRNQRGLITRPSVEEVYKYRKYVDAKIEELLTDEDNLEIRELIILGINHEQQHQELLITDLKHTFSFNPINPVYKENFDLINQDNEETGWLEIEKGLYQIGFEGEGFHFDNEVGRHQVYLNDFQISKALVTNGEYIEFIEAGGYQNFKFWLDEGWSWVEENKIDAPLYWENIDGVWHQYTLGGLKIVEKDKILAHISFYEAQAFANWKGCRLPTEFEWEAASAKFKWGKRWEWTYSAYLPYPKFEIAEGAVGEYNGKFMISQMVLRGASTATPKGHERSTYRNFFHPKYRWQLTGIRLAK